MRTDTISACRDCKYARRFNGRPKSISVTCGLVDKDLVFENDEVDQPEECPILNHGLLLTGPTTDVSPCMLMWGNPGDGFEACGPFVNPEAAAGYAEITKNIRDSSWWTIDLEAPDPEALD